MSTDADDTLETERMEKIDVRVPSTVLDAIESEYPRRGYSSRSEAVRDALRDWLKPENGSGWMTVTNDERRIH